MPRIGMNPGRGKKLGVEPSRVTAAVLTFLPNKVGYFKDRFDVMRACIESIIKNTEVPVDLMVFDNGSCAEVIDYLRNQYSVGNIDYLILAGRNIGKINALRIIFQSAPGEVVAYCDDDVFYLPGWLKRHLEVIDTYPDVGMVSGMYIKSHMREGIKSTLKFAGKRDVSVEKGNLISKELEHHYIENMGRTWEQYNREIKGYEDIRMTYKGITTFASAGHYQFVAVRDRFMKALPEEWSQNLMGQMRELDVAIDNLNMLRVCTTPATLRLLGNQISEEGAEYIQRYGIDIEGAAESKQMPNWMTRFFRLPLIQKIAYFFYQRLFKIINA